MEENIEVLTGYNMHYQVFASKTDEYMCGYIFNGHIGFKRKTKTEDAIAKVRKTIEDDGKTVAFYSVKSSNVKRFNEI